AAPEGTPAERPLVRGGRDDGVDQAEPGQVLAPPESLTVKEGAVRARLHLISVLAGLEVLKDQVVHPADIGGAAPTAALTRGRSSREHRAASPSHRLSEVGADQGLAECDRVGGPISTGLDAIAKLAFGEQPRGIEVIRRGPHRCE